MRSSSIAVLVAIAVAAWITSQGLQGLARLERADWPVEQEYKLLPPPKVAPLLAAGYNELAADLTWARTLVYHGSKIVGDEDYQYLNKFIDNVIALDPHFKRIYQWAPYAVLFKTGVVTSDEYLVSVRYLERAMEQYPDDYWFFWQAGLYYFVDLARGDPEKAEEYQQRGVELIEAAMHRPNAPPDIVTLAANLRTKLGQEQRALADLQQMILTTDNIEAQQKMIATYKALAPSERAEEITRARQAFEDLRYQNLPTIPADFLVILGPKPSPVIDFDKLATSRALFGSEEPETINLFPDSL